MQTSRFTAFSVPPVLPTDEYLFLVPSLVFAFFGGAKFSKKTGVGGLGCLFNRFFSAEIFYKAITSSNGIALRGDL